MNFEDQLRELSQVGLNLFSSAPVSSIPKEIYSFSENQKSKTLVIIGHGGKTLWEHVKKTSSHLDPSAHPIDQFSLSHIKSFAVNILKDEHIEILFPNDDYLLPLQKLGRFFNLAQKSALEIDISKEYGLWFAYRGVFLTDKPLPIISPLAFCSPCDTCHVRPCLTGGRNYCPYKSEHQYTPSQQAFHALQLSLL